MMINTITLKMKYVLCVLMLTLFCTLAKAQERTCGMEAYMLEKMADPEFVREYESNQLKFREELERVNQNDGLVHRRATLVIPVAVHFPEGNENDRACLEAFAQNQIDILNKDYTLTNPDFSQWSAASTFYPGVVPGSVDLLFCIATTNHPQNTDAQLVEGGPAVTIGWNFGNGGDADIRWGGYMNFLVKTLGNTDLGYSPLGGSIAAGQAVVMNKNAFASGQGCPGYVPQPTYNLGRTVTHELGHFYNLNHTFGNTSGCGADDDGIADTPQVGPPTYGCPIAGSVNGCVAGQKALTMNYMDYTNDACMYMFTTGQTNVVSAYLNVLQAQFKPNVAACSVPPDFSFATSTNSQSACPSAGSVSYNFNFVTQGGFNESTVFSATGQPAGTTVTFSPTSRSTNGPVIMTIGNLGTAALGNYTIAVAGTSASITNSQNVSLNLRNTPCVSVANTQFATSTTGVVFNTISNLNSGKPSGYSDYTSISTNVNRNSSYPLTVNVNTDGNYQVITRVWVDWNQNCRFDDAGELYELGTTANVPNNPTANSPLAITIPMTATLGNTIMRVTTKYTNPGANQVPTSCENGHDAEVEDYTLNVLMPLGVEEFGIDNFSIFPNPNKGQFAVKLNSDSSELVRITVFDIRGRKIYDQKFENTSNFNQSIDLDNVQSGMYLVKVSNGDKQATKKIIVE